MPLVSVYFSHHAQTDETWVFRLDEYDNDFDTQPDEADENWNYNYEPYSGGAWWINGYAYNQSFYGVRKPSHLEIDLNGQWIDGNGGHYHFAESGDKIAWYLDAVKMLKEDFDPEDRIPDPEGPTASEPHQHSLGVCDDYAMVAVGYLRAIGVPSRLATGWFDSDGHTWVQWNNVTGDEKWHHLDVDYGYEHSEWEAEDSWKYNRLYYHTDDGITWDHIWVRDSEDVNDVIDIAGRYNRLTHRSMAYSTTRSEIICNYKILGVPTFKPGKETTISINITNPTSESKTINVTVLLISPYLPPGGTPFPLTGATKQVTIPANSEMIEEMNITVPGDASSGDYNLEIYEEENLALQQATQVLAEYEVTTEMPDEIVYEQPFTFSTTIKNNATAPIHNISVELDTHYYFNTTDPLRKEIAILNTGESHTFTWSLTPIWYGDLRIDVGVSTSDAGFETKMVTIPVLQTPELHITPQVPEKVEKGDDFFLKATVSNSGDIPSDPVILEITTPENVTANRTSVDLGIIDAHKNKTCSFLISQNESEDFVILLNSTSLNATAESYAFINIIQPNMWIDILKEDETPGIVQHTSVIETLADEPCNLTVYISNTGDEKLSNIQILTNVNVTKDVGDITEGEAKQISIEFTPTTPGLSELNVTVKSDEIEKNVTRTLLVEKFDFTASIPKTRYNRNEPVPINISVTNEVPDMRFVDLKIVINISNPIYNRTFEIPLLSLAPLETKNTSFTWDTTEVSNGTYTIGTSLVMANREVVSDEEKQVCIGKILLTDLPNVELVSADPTVTSINVTSLNLSEINETYKPEECIPLSAYMINSTGAGNFTLRFTDIPNANLITVYKINTTNQWLPLDTSTTTTNVTFTMDVGDYAVVFGSTVFVELYTGWNMISLPLKPADLSASSVLATIPNAGGIAYLWNASKGAYDAIYGDIELEPGRAYWVSVTGDGTWTPTGSEIHGTKVNLTPGWNMIGVPSALNTSVRNINITVGADTYTLVEAVQNGYIGGIFYSWNTANEEWDATIISDTAVLKPGTGYFANVKQACAITYP